MCRPCCNHLGLACSFLPKRIKKGRVLILPTFGKYRLLAVLLFREVIGQRELYNKTLLFSIIIYFTMSECSQTERDKFEVKALTGAQYDES